MRYSAIAGWFPRPLPEYVWARKAEPDPWAALDQRRPRAGARREQWERDWQYITAAADAWRAAHPAAVCGRRHAITMARLECFRPPEPAA